MITLRMISTFTASIALASSSSALAESSTTRAGNELSFAIPTVTLGAELLRGERDGALQYTESLAVTLLGTEVLKRTTHVERPDHANDQSFPSGHASRAFSAATYVHRRYGLEPALPLYLLGTYVGYTRVQAHQHRWADVAGSAALSAAASWWLVQPRSGALGFAEGLPMEHAVAANEVVARLESGRTGLAVEFRVSDSVSRYSIVPLGLEAPDGARRASDAWPDILRAVHGRLAPNDDA